MRVGFLVVRGGRERESMQLWGGGGGVYIQHMHTHVPMRMDMHISHAARAHSTTLLGHALVSVPYLEWDGCKGAGLAVVCSRHIKFKTSIHLPQDISTPISYPHHYRCVLWRVRTRTYPVCWYGCQEKTQHDLQSGFSDVFERTVERTVERARKRTRTHKVTHTCS